MKTGCYVVTTAAIAVAAYIIGLRLGVEEAPAQVAFSFLVLMLAALGALFAQDKMP